MPAQQQQKVVGPFRGMRFARGEYDAGLAYVIQGMVPNSRGIPSPLVKMAAPDRRYSVATAGLTGQALYGWRDKGQDVAVASGEIYAGSAGGGFLKEVTAANLAAAGIVLSAAARVYICQFAGVLVFNDGINVPFTWDGTFGGGLTKLTNAPARCFGQPTVYYGKLFFIKADPATGNPTNVIDWSEENQPNTGFEAGGFNNSWALTQSGQGAVYALVGTNAALYYFRADSVGAIRGAVTPTFQGDGVQDDVTTLAGTTLPEAAALVGDTVWFTDNRGRVWAFGPGEAPTPIWEQVADLYVDGPRAPGAVVGVQRGAFVFVELAFMAFIVLDAATRQPLCFWIPPQSMHAAPGVRVVAAPLLGGVGDPSAVMGILYNQTGDSTNLSIECWPSSAAQQYHYAFVSGLGSLSPMVLTLPISFGPNTLAQWSEAEVRFYLLEGDNNPTASLYVNQKAEVKPASLPAAPPGDFDLVGGVSQALAAVADAHVAPRKVWGLRRRLRELSVAVIGSLGANEQAPFGVETITVRAVATLAPSKIATS